MPASTDSAAKDVHQRGGKRNAATITSANRTKGRSRMVVTLPGDEENTHSVIPSKPQPMAAISAAGGGGTDHLRARRRMIQLTSTGATHKDPSQLPAHHSCHSRR